MLRILVTCWVLTILVTTPEACAQAAKLHFSRITTGPVATDRASTGGVSWVDYDGDGDLDLFVANGYDVSAEQSIPQPNRLYQNQGAGRLVSVPSPLEEAGFSSGSAWGDFDNDGDEDVFIPNQSLQQNFLFRNDAQRGFSLLEDSPVTTDSAHSFSATWADVDNDGYLDLFVSNGGLSGPERNFLYRNQGNGTFTPITQGPIVADSIQSKGAVWVDYDLDGDVDLFVPGAPNAFFQNEGNWRFTKINDLPFVTEPPLLRSPESAAWGDYDNDGDFDLYVPYPIGEQNRLYKNEGNGQFRRINEGLPVLDGGYSEHALWADFDHDGYLDLLVANWGSPVVLYMNRRDGQFERQVYGDLGTTVSFASSVAVGDYDNDGDLDIIVGHWPNEPGSGEENLFYRNDGPVGNWLQLDLVGTRSNRSAIGARVVVRVRIDGRLETLTREVRSQEGWRSQNSRTVHLGLGNAQLVEEVSIYWPSGHRQQLTNLRANQRITVTETPR